MVVLPVRLVSATESHRGRFREIHHRDGGRARHKRVCEVEGTQEDTVRGRRAGGGAAGRAAGADHQRRPRIAFPGPHGTWRKSSASSRGPTSTR
ncbi:hypothetical protein ACWGJW_39295 [Streptomyces nigrescens]